MRVPSEQQSVVSAQGTILEREDPTIRERDDKPELGGDLKTEQPEKEEEVRAQVVSGYPLYASTLCCAQSGTLVAIQPTLVGPKFNFHPVHCRSSSCFLDLPPSPARIGQNGALRFGDRTEQVKRSCASKLRIES